MDQATKEKVQELLKKVKEVSSNTEIKKLTEEKLESLASSQTNPFVLSKSGKEMLEQQFDCKITDEDLELHKKFRNQFVNSQGKITLDFYQVTKPISIKDGKEELCRLDKAEMIMRVGESIIAVGKPIDLLYLTDFGSMYRDGLIERVTDENVKSIILDFFIQSKTLPQLEVVATRDFMVQFEFLEDFVKIPEEFKPIFRQKLEKILKR